MGEKQFCSLEYFNCCWVGVGGGLAGVEQKILFRTCGNRIFRVPDFIQGWETRGESKILFFLFLMLIKGTRR